MHLFTNIRTLVQARQTQVSPLRGGPMNHLPCIDDAFLIVENGLIHSFGKMSDLPELKPTKTTDCSNRFVFPGWVDSHTHLVYAASRESEFRDKINGLTYEEIAGRGGGILNSVKRLREISESELFELAKQRLIRLIQSGTTAIEIKSGYGLDLNSELKMLRVVRALKRDFPMVIKATFLGAHAVPPEFKANKKGYVDLIVNEIIPAVAQEQLADYVDVFCEKNYFDTNETQYILSAAKQFGLRPKIHTNQFTSMGGIEMALANEAITVDHLEVLTEKEIELLQNSPTIAVGLPNCSFYLGIDYTPAKQLINAGAAFALASDYNPGSAPSGNMSFVVALACIKMKLTPEQAINAATINAAHSIESEPIIGSISPGKRADFFISKPMQSLAYLPYSFGENLVDRVYLNGELFKE